MDITTSMIATELEDEAYRLQMKFEYGNNHQHFTESLRCAAKTHLAAMQPIRNQDYLMTEEIASGICDPYELDGMQRPAKSYDGMNVYNRSLHMRLGGGEAALKFQLKHLLADGHEFGEWDLSDVRTRLFVERYPLTAELLKEVLGEYYPDHFLRESRLGEACATSIEKLVRERLDEALRSRWQDGSIHRTRSQLQAGSESDGPSY